MFGIFFTDQGPVTDYAGATACDQARFRAFFHGMLGRGIYLAPSAFEAGFVSAAHAPSDIATTLEAAEATFAEIS
jgi:glutamate-1-semialdehyde 2,1-aminomutase